MSTAVHETSAAVAPLLEVTDLVKHFPCRSFGRSRGWRRDDRVVRAVAGASFTLGRSETLGLVGESGCGKSTLARAVVGLLRPTSGSVRLDGDEVAGLSRRAWLRHRRRIQMVFQDPYASLDPRQTVASILSEPLRIHGFGGRRACALRVMQLLDAVGLNPRHLHRYPHEFSGGQRQRLGIARALALEPDIVICDEPVSSLDVSIRAQIINLLKELQARFGLAYLFISHDLAVVRQICTRVAVMYLGRIVEIGEREQLFREPRHPYTRALLSAAPIADPERERARRRIVLAGDVPSPIDPPSGCAFHPRCPERARVTGDACARVRPELRPVEGAGDSHACACHLYAHPDDTAGA